MTPWLSDPDLDLYVGDVRDVLPTLESESVDCVATSPPFFGLRDYGEDAQIGLEQTPEEWVDALVGVFRECRRVLRPHGTLWVEVGDSYAQYDGQGNKNEPREPGMHGSFNVSRKLATTAEARGDRHSLPSGFKRKDLLLQPFMLAMALRADGWYLRQVIVWHKPNAMPESVRDRCTTAHSYVLLLSKQPRYFFDSDAIAEEVGPDAIPRALRTSKYDDREVRDSVPYSAARPRAAKDGNGDYTGMKNARSVWTIPTSGYSGAHFATFPEKLVERMLLAGCPERVCGTCGKPRERLTEVSYTSSRNPGAWSEDGDAQDQGARARSMYAASGVATRNAETVGWSDCAHDNYRPGVVLDPFLGSGTTALVARRHGRRTIGVELNESYAAMAAERLNQLSLLA